MAKEKCCPAWLIPISDEPTMEIRQHIVTTSVSLPGIAEAWQIPMTVYYLALSESALPAKTTTDGEAVLIYLSRPSTPVEEYCMEAKKLMNSYKKDRPRPRRPRACGLPLHRLLIDSTTAEKHVDTTAPPHHHSILPSTDPPTH
jgi:hypothetical protein